MKKVFFAVMAMFAIVMVSCSSGYNQKTVDDLMAKLEKLGDDQKPSEADYKTAIEQLNYAYDEMEKSGDPVKFEEQNPKIAESVMQLSFIVAMAGFDEDCPESVKKDMEDLSARAKKIGQ